MFSSGSSTLQPYAAQILREIGQVINHVPNRISLSGHTDATPYGGSSQFYSNWELSADRANASRRALNNGGMSEEKVARVVGLSSAVLFDKANPLNPINRRISIIVLNKETEDAILHDEGKLDQTTIEAQKLSEAEKQEPVAQTPAAAPAGVPDIRPNIQPIQPGNKPAPSSSATAAASAASAAAEAAARR
jgi:chemotaxis protein MotB